MIKDKDLEKVSLKMEFGSEISKMASLTVTEYGKRTMDKGLKVFGKMGVIGNHHESF